MGGQDVGCKNEMESLSVIDSTCLFVETISKEGYWDTLAHCGSEAYEFSALRSVVSTVEGDRRLFSKRVVSSVERKRLNVKSDVRIRCLTSEENYLSDTGPLMACEVPARGGAGRGAGGAGEKRSTAFGVRRLFCGGVAEHAQAADRLLWWATGRRRECVAALPRDRKL
ncbi:hypothetical protein EVAR_21728_1 [Eumeta japonica]|uniref:Uncharacterized protein n=1 Tax=Eumeta variegata TaxID=151549 RepID=A0A4C1W7R3_EUMVA|nr:hypothetical protein EVAR_21728_1 [Eumeta japonica]